MELKNIMDALSVSLLCNCEKTCTPQVSQDQVDLLLLTTNLVFYVPYFIHHSDYICENSGKYEVKEDNTSIYSLREERNKVTNQNIFFHLPIIISPKGVNLISLSGI